ncbi:MTRF1L release factor glutamine methyltransferase isoform X2 [Cherax quadricarinatus]|uniref:MTRF1L release factor glutamine methyltransferase isoform X2 n=1 Tax=Cherax quadricarinatus TaxID=27406 RepID=UPI00387E36E8
MLVSQASLLLFMMPLPVCLRRFFSIIKDRRGSVYHNSCICKNNLSYYNVQDKTLNNILKNCINFYRDVPSHFEMTHFHKPSTSQNISQRHLMKNSHRLPQSYTRFSPARGMSMKHFPCALYQRLTQTGLSHRAYTTGSFTVKDTLIDWRGKLEAAQVPEADLAVEHIMSHILGVPQELEKLTSVVLSKEILTEVDRLMTCRLARMPLQYILGEWDFHSVTLKMRPPVFIPRPETEQLVELALECLQGIHTPRVLEIGCGSGAISLSLLHSINNLQCVALDQSKHAIELTKLNASNIGVNDRLLLVEGKVTSEMMPCLPRVHFHLIVSNPPYVLRKDLLNVQPEIKIYEDMRALDGGKDGLDVIKAILIHSHRLLLDKHSVILEVDPCHRYLIPVWLEKQPSLKVKFTEVFKDFNGKDRFIKFVKS